MALRGWVRYDGDPRHGVLDGCFSSFSTILVDIRPWVEAAQVVPHPKVFRGTNEALYRPPMAPISDTFGGFSGPESMLRENYVHRFKLFSLQGTRFLRRCCGG